VSTDPSRAQGDSSTQLSLHLSDAGFTQTALRVLRTRPSLPQLGPVP
jgi:hypothetical protein